LNLAKLNKLKEEQLKELEKSEEAYIVAMDYFERGNSERCWKTEKQARETFDKLKSEAQKLKAVKAQILIRKLGFGWLDCGHKWSQSGYHYTSKECYDT
jgi:hypothetical protein